MSRKERILKSIRTFFFSFNILFILHIFECLILSPFCCYQYSELLVVFTQIFPIKIAEILSILMIWSLTPLSHTSNTLLSIYINYLSQILHGSNDTSVFISSNKHFRQFVIKYLRLNSLTHVL